MASRTARAVFSAAARVTARPTRVVHHIGRRHNSTSSHGSSATSSDTPWIIGSVLVFGPALLYLLSPSARKKNTATHVVHDGDQHVHTSRHESTADAPAPAVHTEVKMTDDESTEQNVTESLAVAQHEDVPKVGEPIQDMAIPDVAVTPGIENVKEQVEEGVKSAPGEPGGKEDMAEINGEEGPADLDAVAKNEA